MQDRISPQDLEPLRNWTVNHRTEYIQSGGVKGHIIDVRVLDGHRYATMLLLRCVGRKSGRTVITPLLYGNYGGEVVIAGTNNGGDRHPAWYHNIKGGSEVAFQIATQAFTATWREPETAEYERVWDYMVGISPRYKTYRTMTTRHIPLLMLTPGEEIPVFKE